MVGYVNQVDDERVAVDGAGLMVVAHDFDDARGQLPAFQESGADFGVVDAEDALFGLLKRDALVERQRENGPNIDLEERAEDYLANVVEQADRKSLVRWAKAQLSAALTSET